jgi:hypothetical protein
MQTFHLESTVLEFAPILKLLNILMKTGGHPVGSSRGRRNCKIKNQGFDIYSDEERGDFTLSKQENCDESINLTIKRRMRSIN